MAARGRISVYEKSGQYQLYVEAMEPAGLGDLHQAFEKLKEKLARRGYLTRNGNDPCPHCPSRSGLITSPTGAAIQDMIKILRAAAPIWTF